jgi:alpha-tubulin suppressor-like RCC1 family protein
MAFNGTGSNVTALNASNISSGTVATGRLATSGTASNTTFLRGDQIWSALPASGGLTNNVRQAITSSATTTIDVNSGNVVDLTMAASISTLTFSNVPASGTPLQLVIVFRNDAAGTNYQVTWPASIYWNSGTVEGSIQGPQLTAGPNSLTIVSLLTTDGGTKWRGWVEATMVGGSINNLWTWGSNGSGALGLGNTVSRSSPVQVGSSKWVQVQSGNDNRMLALSSFGILFTWGSGGDGKLGLNDEISRSLPVQIGSRTDWATFSLSTTHTLALTTTGQLWAWGVNGNGQLGQNDTISRSSPVQIGNNSNWAVISAGSHISAAITTSGQLWTWGRNNYGGPLGLNDTISRSLPAQVGALTTWASVSMGGYFTLATTTAGTLFSWGAGSFGRLGQNDAVNRSSPTQVGALTTWASIKAGGRTSMALTTSGTLFMWGYNVQGQLGQNDTVNRSSPTQVGALTTWAKLPSALSYSVGAITTSGTLFMWGYNNTGELGQNDRVNRSSPVQVGANTDWVVISSQAPAAGLRIDSTINPA